MSTEPLGNQQSSTRPISIAHLVFGLVFAGIAVIWLIGELTDVEAPGFALWGPAVLIGAGVVGLVASLAGSRRRSRPAETGEPEPIGEPEPVEEPASGAETTTALSDLDDSAEDTRTFESPQEER